MKINETKLIAIFVGIFVGIRFLSFYTRNLPTVGATTAFFSIVIFIFLYFKKRLLAWQFIAAEILLGGAGIFFQLITLSLRTWLLLVTALLLAIELVPRKINFLFVAFGVSLVMSAIVGFTNQHKTIAVIQDIIPFCFFLYTIPFRELLNTEKGFGFVRALAKAYIIGSALSSTFTLFLFSSGLSVLQNPYYKWFRDVVVGKITDMGEGFYRVVNPEHLILTPIIIILAANLTKKENIKNYRYWLLLALGLIPFVINFSRIYILALFVGLVVIKYGSNWKKWLMVSSGTVGLFISLFVVINLLASSGQSTGLDLLGFRFSTLVRPATEESSLSRLTLLQPIKELILEHPIIGSGFGATITYVSPRTKLPVTTSQFDWGYLEMWAEMGLIGSILYLSIIAFIIVNLIKNSVLVGIENSEGLLAALISILVINLTAPALIHALGVVLLTYYYINFYQPLQKN